MRNAKRAGRIGSSEGGSSSSAPSFSPPIVDEGLLDTLWMASVALQQHARVVKEGDLAAANFASGAWANRKKGDGGAGSGGDSDAKKDKKKSDGEDSESN